MSSVHRWPRHRARSSKGSRDWRHRSHSPRSRSPPKRRSRRHHTPSPCTSSRSSNHSSSTSSFSPDKSRRRKRRHLSDSSRSAQSHHSNHERRRSSRNEEPSSSTGSGWLVSSWTSSREARSRRDISDEAGVDSHVEASREHSRPNRGGGSWRDRRDRRRNSAEAWVTGVAAPPDVDPEVWASLPPEAREWAVAPAVGEAAAAAAAGSDGTHPLRGLYSTGSSSASSASGSSNPIRTEAAVGADRPASSPSWQDVQLMEGRISRHIRLLERIHANVDGAPNSSPAIELDGTASQSRTYEQDQGYSAAPEDMHVVQSTDKIAAALSEEPDEPITLKACMVCMDEPASSTFVHGKTGHTVCCLPCAEMIFQRQGTCPVCCQEVSLVIRNFFN